MQVLKRFLRDEGGLETVEWAFVLGFAILTAVLALLGAREHMISIFSRMANEVIRAAGQVSGGL